MPELTDDQQREHTLLRQQKNAVATNASKESKKAEALLLKRPLDILALTTCLTKLRDYRTRLASLNNEILRFTDEKSLEEEMAKASSWDEHLFDIAVRTETVVENAKSPIADTSHNLSAASSVSHSVKLPKLEIPKYDGDPLCWQEFWDTFESTVHSSDLPDIEKMKYLRSFLKGDAHRLVSGYRLTNANYGAVIDALKQRFGDPEIAIFSHFDAMLAMPIGSSNVSALQRAFDDCERHIRSLVALGLEEDTFGRVFTPIMLSKLPENVRIELHRRKGAAPWSLAQLRLLLKDEIHARDMSKRTLGAQSSSQEYDSNRVNSSKHSRNNGWQNRQNSVCALVSSDKNPNNSFVKQKTGCHFCNGQHFSDKCQKYPDLSSRMSQINGACFRCLGSDHQSRNCRSKRLCFYCKDSRHHCSLCAKKFSAGEGGAKSAHQMSTGASAGFATGLKSASAIIMSHGKRGILQTAIAKVVVGGTVFTARLLLDPGADNSFIANSLVKKFGVRSTGSETLSVAAFEDKRRKSVQYRMYGFDILFLNGKKLSVAAYGTDVITCAIDKHSLDVEKNPVLARLPLAEPLADSTEQVEIDILIASDYYYDIVKSERIPLEGGLLLLDSELGYVVAGRLESGSTNSVQMLLTRSSMPPTNFDLERFWRLEEIGIKDPPEECDDEIALKQFNETIQFDSEENRYVVKWPWKSAGPTVPDNFALSFGRLKSLVARMKDTPAVIEKYKSTIDDQIEKGVVEEAPTIPDGDVVHYIPITV